MFDRALALSHSQREAFLAEACADDPELLEELASLLSAHEAAGPYFDGLAERVILPALSAVTHTTDEPGSTRVTERLQVALAGSYRVLEELGGAGMSRIFVAEDLRLKRRVVLKVLPSETVHSDGAGRFRQEIELAAQLQHPYIVPLLAADASEGMLYYTMPLVAGESLKDRLAREGPLALDVALRVWRDVLDALAHAHARGVVHRDIKPGNILLSGRHALVTDFGIAHAIESAAGDANAATPGVVIGTPAYMAPEQAAGAGEVDPRVDVYQAGLVMYEMLSGGLPFPAGPARELLRSRIEDEPIPLLRPEAPDHLVALVMACLERNPEARPHSASALLEELERLAGRVGGKSSATGPPGPMRAAVVAAAVLAASLLTFVSATRGWQAMSEPRASTRPAAASPSTARHTPDVAAYEWYARGTDVALMRSDTGTLQAIDYLERAIAIDSLYAAAYGALARLYVQRWNAAPTAERPAWAELARTAAARAIAIDDSDPEALVALGWVRMVEGDLPAAERFFTLALAQRPSVPRGHEGLARLYMIAGRPVEQLAEAELGVELEPFSHSAIRELALALSTNDRCEEAIIRLRPLKGLSPPSAVAGVISGMCYASREMWPEAVAEFTWARELGASFGSAFLGYSLARASLTDEAEAILADLLTGREESHGAFGVATIYAGLRDYDQAFAWLDRAVGDESINQYVMHPVFADLQHDPRFGRVRASMGAPPTSP